MLVFMDASASLHGNISVTEEQFDAWLAKVGEDPPMSLRFVCFALKSIAKFCDKRRAVTLEEGEKVEDFQVEAFE